MPDFSESPIFFSSPLDFRNWLQRNHRTAEVQWVGFYKKSSGIDSITWPESVDQALCFGWIDGLRKSVDEKSYKIRFTPRKKNSHWSTVNLKRYKALKEKGLVQTAGEQAYKIRNKKNTKKASYEQKKVSLKSDYLEKIKSNEIAWQYYITLSPYIMRTSNWWIMSAKREETKQRRLAILIKSCMRREKIPPLQISKKKK